VRFREQIAVSGQVIGALVLRDMRTRFGLGYLGFLGSFVVPFVHIGVIVAINYVLGRVVPVGTDALLYLSLAILPFILFIYTARQMLQAITANRPLFHFPRVKMIDSLIARSVVEIVGAVVMAVVVLAVLHLGETPFRPASWSTFLAGLVASVAIGFSLGLVFATLAALTTVSIVLFIGVAMVFWGLSGAFFIPDMIPEPYRSWLWYNPLLHATELVRVGYYSEYASQTLDPGYVVWFCVACTALGLVLPWLLRQEILRA
jgi:capsular polysaccharide transport system permease protein